MTGNYWRTMRYKLSPLFTTGKLKFMFQPMSDCGQHLMEFLDEKVGKEVDIKEVNSLFAMDVIGSCAFGIDAGVLKNPSSNFSIMGKKMFEVNFWRVLVLTFISFLPKLAFKLGISFIPKDVSEYFFEIVLGTLKFRKEQRIHRQDFVQLLMQLKEKGIVQMPVHDPTDAYLKMEKSDDILEFAITDDMIVGTSFTFIFAGFHTTAATMTYAFHELAYNHYIQEKARKEVREQIQLHRGVITYDALKSMTYLDKILKETMRLHPAVPIIFRVCTKQYTFRNGYTINPGEGILIPILGLHKDPNYFPNPTLFNPDRFDVQPISGSYLPFGEGPRICIAMRFALLEMKYALAKILNSYNLSPCESTATSLKMEPRALLSIPKGKVILKIEKI